MPRILDRLKRNEPFPTDRVRHEFPILGRTIQTDHGPRPVTFLDHGASTHAPRPVIDAVTRLMESGYANVHRGNHTLSRECSLQFEDAVQTLAGFVGGQIGDVHDGGKAGPQTLVLGSNTTQVLDLAAHVMQGVEGATLTTLSEHHSNDLPHRKRGKTYHAAIDESGRVDLDDVQERLAKGDVKLLAITGASNVTGWMPPIHKLARMAHDADARILVDAAQLYAHAPIDVKPVGHPEHLDFVAAAGHKSYAPFGSSFLLGPTDLMDQAPPYMPGGGTVQWVTADDVGYTTGMDRHVGGTPNITGVIAFAAATKWLDGIGMETVRDHERALVRHGLKRFEELEPQGVHLLGPTGRGADAERCGLFTFVVDGLHHANLSDRLDRGWGIATRNGCFCAHPLLHKLLKVGDVAELVRKMEQPHGRDLVDIPGATRASLGIYNTEHDLDLLAEAVAELAKEGKRTATPALASNPAATAPTVPAAAPVPALKPGKANGKASKGKSARGKPAKEPAPFTPVPEPAVANTETLVRTETLVPAEPSIQASVAAATAPVASEPAKPSAVAAGTKAASQAVAQAAAQAGTKAREALLKLRSIKLPKRTRPEPSADATPTEPAPTAEHDETHEVHVADEPMAEPVRMDALPDFVPPQEPVAAARPEDPQPVETPTTTEPEPAPKPSPAANAKPTRKVGASHVPKGPPSKGAHKPLPKVWKGKAHRDEDH